jgi:hypothetical protein
LPQVFGADRGRRSAVLEFLASFDFRIRCDQHCSMPEILQPGLTIFIDCESLRSYIALAQSRTCLWVSADPRMVRAIGKVTGANPSSRSVANHKTEDTLKQRRCGPFWFSSGRPKTGVTKEAHLHCRQCGRGLPSKPRQTKRTEAGQGQGSPPRDGISWFRGLHRLVPWI